MMHLYIATYMHSTVISKYLLMQSLQPNTVVRKFFDRKYFIDKKIQGKIFSLMHDFLEIFLP